MSNKDVHLTPFRINTVTKTPQEHVPKGVDMINSTALWEAGRQGEGKYIGVIDTGAACGHPDLKRRINDAVDFTGSIHGPEDKNGHGSHVAGSIAADNQGSGIVGVAPKADLLILKALNDQGFGNQLWTIQAIYHAVEEGVNILNMSLGGAHLPALKDAIRYAISKGVKVVAAAGNEGDGLEFTPEFSFPGYYDPVIQVGAVDYDGNLAPFSNTNSRIDVLAPGVDILSTYKDGQYAKLSGTSMATPHVAGAYALAMNAFKDDKNILNLAI